MSTAPSVNVEQLMKFYSVETIDDLIKEQADHVKQLQDTIKNLRPHEPAFVGRAPREG